MHESFTCDKFQDATVFLRVWETEVSPNFLEKAEGTYTSDGSASFARAPSFLDRALDSRSPAHALRRHFDVTSKGLRSTLEGRSQALRRLFAGSSRAPRRLFAPTAHPLRTHCAPTAHAAPITRVPNYVNHGCTSSGDDYRRRFGD